MLLTSQLRFLKDILALDHIFKSSLHWLTNDFIHELEDIILVNVFFIHFLLFKCNAAFREEVSTIGFCSEERFISPSISRFTCSLWSGSLIIFSTNFSLFGNNLGLSFTSSWFLNTSLINAKGSQMEYSWKIFLLDPSWLNGLVWLVDLETRVRGFSYCRWIIGVPSLFCIMKARVLFTFCPCKARMFWIW